MLSISGSFAPLALGSNPDMGWCLTKSEARHRYRMTTRTPIGNLSLSLRIATQTLFMMALYSTEVLCNRNAAILWMYIWLAVWARVYNIQRSSPRSPVGQHRSSSCQLRIHPMTVFVYACRKGSSMKSDPPIFQATGFKASKLYLHLNLIYRSLCSPLLS